MSIKCAEPPVGLLRGAHKIHANNLDNFWKLPTNLANCQFGKERLGMQLGSGNEDEAGNAV